MNIEDIENLIDEKMSDYTNLNVPNHTHNGSDSLQINPINLLGFPVIQVADVTVAPTDAPLNGTFRFYVDITPDYRLWAYLIYKNATGVSVGAWKSVVLA